VVPTRDILPTTVRVRKSVNLVVLLDGRLKHVSAEDAVTYRARIGC
jgi:hypothetical protein